MANLWFTSDTHMGHANIIKYCSRPFSSHEEMDEAILARFCEVLRPGDVLYHLGDVSFSTFSPETFLRRLPTKEVHLIRGNHDQLPDAEYLRRGFRTCREVHRISPDRVPVDLFHYAQRTWRSKGRGGLHLFGHSHNSLPGLDRSMDVGVDTNNFYPWAWEDVKRKLLALPVFTKMTAAEFESGLGKAHPRPVAGVGEFRAETESL